MKVNWGLKNKLSKKSIFIGAILLIVLGITVFRVVEALAPVEEKAEAPVSVTTATAEMGTIYATAPLTGRIDPVESASVIPMTAGQVTAVNVAIGDRVSKGTVLFRIDQTQASVLYNQAKLAANNAKENYDRISSLYKEGAVSLQAYQGAETQYRSAAESLTAASEALSYCTVTSPINGYVTSVNVSVGSLVSQAAPAVTVADVSALEINTAISEYLVGKVNVGDPVEIYIDTLSEKPFNGSISALSPAPAQGTLTYPVTISVEDPEGKVQAGMFAEIQIVSAKKEHVLCIPSDAVFLKSGKSKVAVLEGDIPKLVDVKTGLDNGESVEVVSGLKAGNIIIVTGQQFITEGEAVNITK